MGDKYDQLCECALICLTPSDFRLLDHCSAEYAVAFKRAKVNSGTRAVMPDADCQVCGGNGEKPDQSTAA